MTPNLTQVVHNPSVLDSISVTEIEELISQVPSSDIYRMILDKKMSRNHSHESILAGSDKMLLSEFSFEAVLDLQNVSELEKKTTTIENTSTNTEMKEESVVFNVEHQGLAEDVIIYEKTDVKIENSENENIIPLNENENTAFENMRVEEIKNDLEAEIDENETLPKNKKIGKKKKQKQKSFKLKEYSGISEYAKWLLTFKNVDVEKQIRKEEKAAKKRALEANAKKSVTKSDLIASEPLAEILAIQGHFDDAKKMYEQLMHKYPEKSSYFAAKINNLLKI